MNFAQTELLIHVVNRDTNRILDVDRWVGSVLYLPACLPWNWGKESLKEAQTPPSGHCVGLPPRGGQGWGERMKHGSHEQRALTL